MRRNIRRRIDATFTLIGILLIFGSFLYQSSMQPTVQFMAILVGILLMEIGVWNLSSRILPNERRYIGFRHEGDNMMNLIRELNSAAIAKDRGEEDAKRFQDTLAKMHDSIARLSKLAAKE